MKKRLSTIGLIAAAVLAFGAIAFAAANAISTTPSPAVITHTSSDNPATHDVRDDNGVDNPATHDVNDDKGVDNPVTHDVADDKGVDNPATHDVTDDKGGASSPSVTPSQSGSTSGSDDSGSHHTGTDDGPSHS